MSDDLSVQPTLRALLRGGRPEPIAEAAFSRIGDQQVRFLPYGALERDREAMARFGSGLKAIEAIAREIVPRA